jgi:hypothetical protein
MEQNAGEESPVKADRAGPALLRSEDWLAVWLGFLVIGLVLVGVRPELPKFAWASTSELTG